MIRVLMFFSGNILPIVQGSDRYIYEVARNIHSCSNVSLTLVVLGEPSEAMRNGANKICSKIVWLPRPRRWGAVDVVNKLFARCGIDLMHSYANARALRGKFAELCADQDLILINYAEWFPLLPRDVRGRKGVVVTLDIGWYRKESFLKTHYIWNRFGVWLNKWLELRVLRSFRRIVVLADYERKLLENEGVSSERIIETGVPLQFGAFRRMDAPIYDFLLIGGCSYQNEETVKCFLSRVSPLLKRRRITFAVAGSICKSKVWQTLSVPENVELRLLGYVDDLADVCAQAKIGVGTVPYGSGIKIKVVEMIANGLPVVVTNHGIEGIPADSAGVVNIDRETSEQCEERLVAWLDDDAGREQVSASSSSKVRNHFLPQNALRGLMECLGN